MRRMIIALAALACASPVLAQSAQQARDTDPTRTVAGGVTVPGWQARLDDPRPGRAAPSPTDVKFAPMGSGMHATTGPAGIYFDPKNARQNVPFTVSVTLGQRVAPRHPEAYGLFIGGRDLTDPARQTYLYFLVRGNGMYYVAHRAGTAVHKLVNWTASDAVKPQNDRGAASNAMSIAVGADSVRFLVNGTQVHAISRQQIGDVSGETGVRVNHNLDVHIGGFSVRPGAK